MRYIYFVFLLTLSTSLLAQSSELSFAPLVTYNTGGYIPTSVAIADVNRDGKPDLLVSNACFVSGNCAGSSVGVLLGNGDGTFQAAVTYASGGDNAYSFAVSDINGDDKPDLIVANQCVNCPTEVPPFAVPIAM